jgi:glycosyltransferase involved in cell wall biosynthesis
MEYNPTGSLPDRQRPAPGLPQVSLGLPVYNGELYLRKALDSLLTQTFSDFELIISDNASTDRTPEICHAYAHKDARIRYIRQAENKGIIWNFNFVLEQAQAQYFMWAAADDQWEPNYIASLVHGLEHDSDAVIAFSGYDVIFVNRNEAEVTTINGYMEDIPSKNLFDRLRNFILYPDKLGKVNMFYGLMRRDVLQQGWESTMAGAAWPRNLFGEDALFVFKMLTMGDLSFEPNILFHKYNYINPTMNKRKVTDVNLLYNIIKNTINYFPKVKSYLNTYVNLIDKVDILTIAEKNYLKKLINKRVRYMYMDYISLTLTSIIKKLSGQRLSMAR